MGKSLLNPLGAKSGSTLGKLTDVRQGTPFINRGTPKTQAPAQAPQQYQPQYGQGPTWTPPGQMYQGAPAGPKTPDTSVVMNQATAGMPPQMQSFFQQQQAARQPPPQQGGKGAASPPPYGGGQQPGQPPGQAGGKQGGSPASFGQALAGRFGGGKNSSAPPPMQGGVPPGASKSGKGTTAPDQYQQQQQGTANAYAQALRGQGGGGGGSFGGSTAQY